MTISQADYAKHRGVHRSAVTQAITAGRLRECVVFVQHGKRRIRRISSIEAADEEWDRNTLYHRTDEADMSPKEARDAKLREASQAELDTASLSEVRRRREIEQLRKLQLQNEAAEREALLEKGEMVLASQVRSDIAQLFAIVRLNIRQVPTRIGQRFPGIGREVLHAMAEEQDRALEKLADME